MPSCTEHHRLMAEYHEAVEDFSKAVTKLRDCNGVGVGFPEQHRATEEARLHAENTRMVLELHRDEHQCGEANRF